MKVGKTLRMVLSFIIAFAMVLPGAVKVNAALAATYPVDSADSVVLEADILGDSQNDHTFAKAFWTYGNDVYVLIESTHDLVHVKLHNGQGSVTSTTLTAYPAGDTVKVGDKVFAPNESQGNTKDAHLTVFKFTLASILSNLGLNEDGSYLIEVASEQGYGHWIRGTLKIYIPKAAARISKTWENGPKDPVKMQLYRDYKDPSIPGDPVPVGTPFTLTEGVNNINYMYSPLNYTDNLGRIYVYSVREVDLGDGYTPTYSAVTTSFENGVHIFTMSVINRYAPPLEDIHVTKVWKDENPNDRPASITIRLFETGGTTPVRTETTTSLKDWKVTFEDVPMAKLDGTPITYFITEDAVPKYTTLPITGFTVTNVRTEKINIDVTKLWKDGKDPSGRPGEVTFNLMIGNKEVKEVKLNSDTGWKGTFTNVDKYDSEGKLINYTITEDPVPGYEGTPTGFTITNLRKAKIDIPVEKIWKDNNDIEGRPQDVTFNLLANGKEVAEMKLTAGMDWKYTFPQVDKYDLNGELITYTISEDNVDGYVGVPTGFKITNTKTGTRNIPVVKTWLDDGDTSGRPLEITVYLNANGKPVDSLKLNKDNMWQDTFANKPMYDQDGKAIAYTVEEIEVPGYLTSYDGFNITNLRIGKTEVPAEKIWMDGDDITARPPFITINLLANGKEVDDMEVTKEMGWKYTFDKLDKYDDKGKLIVYTITEDNVPGYTGDVKGFKITNTRDEMIEIKGTKYWLDEEGSSMRPETIKIILKRNGAKFDEVTIDKDDSWNFSFGEKDAFDENGVAYVYTLEELTVDGYETSYDGFDIYNLRIGEIDIPVEKIWLDNGERSVEEIIVHLYKRVHEEMDLMEVEDPEHDMEHVDTLTLSDENDWMDTFEDLPEFDHMGRPIEYILEEVAVEGYDSEIIMNEDGSYTITNLRVGETNVIGEKTWFDDGEEDRPESITVILKRNGVEDDRKVVTPDEEGQWKYEFLELPEFDEEGIAYTYTVEELPVEGYNAFYVGYDIQNVREGITNVNGEKTWNDLFGRPASITVNLLQNGVKIDEMVIEPDTAGKWLYSFTELPAFDEEGKAYVYTVTENPVTGYAPTITGYNILNRQLRGTLRIEKIDDFDEPVEDVVFEVRNGAGVLIYRGTTDDEGILEVVLPLGTYVVREISAPADYIMDTTPKNVTIDEDGEVVRLTVVNILEVEEVEPKPLPEKPKPQLPSTGAQSAGIWYGMGIFTLLAGVLLLRKRRTI